MKTRRALAVLLAVVAMAMPLRPFASISAPDPGTPAVAGAEESHCGSMGNAVIEAPCKLVGCSGFVAIVSAQTTPPTRLEGVPALSPPPLHPSHICTPDPRPPARLIV